jgi:hypothetical protein
MAGEARIMPVDSAVRTALVELIEDSESKPPPHFTAKGSA